MTLRRAATALAVLLAMTACGNDAGDTGSRGGERTRESFFDGLTTSTETTTTSEPSLAEQQPIRASTVESVNRCFRAWWSLRDPSRETFALSDVVGLTDLCDDAVVATEGDRRGIEGPTPLNTIAVAASAIRLEAATLHLEIASGDRICPDSWCETDAEEVLLDLNLPNEAVELLPDAFTAGWSLPRVSDFAGIVYAE